MEKLLSIERAFLTPEIKHCLKVKKETIEIQSYDKIPKAIFVSIITSHLPLNV